MPAIRENQQSGNDSRAVSNKVFVQRDYSGGTKVKFQTKLPEKLEGKIKREEFEKTIGTLNTLYDEAESMNGAACCEGCLACLTAYLLYACIETRYEKCLRQAAAFIAEQNETVYIPKGVYITDPVERGLRVIEITLLNDQGTNNTTSQPSSRTS